MPNNPFGNVRLTNLPIGQPTNGGQPLNVPIAGAGYNAVVLGFFNRPRDSQNYGGTPDTGAGFARSWNQAIINLVADNPPPGFQTALVTFSASQARGFLNPDGSPKAGYDVRRFCSCGWCGGVGASGGLSGHVWTYAIFYNPGTVPDPPVSETVPEDRCRFCDSCQDCNPPTTFPSLNLSISRFEATTAIYTYFDIAMEVRGNTYCAANITKDSDYKWTPADGNGQDWNRAYFWILDNKFAGWADGVTPSPISFPSTLKIDPVFPPQRVKINNDGWLVEKINLNTPLLPPTFPNTSVYDKLPGGGGLTTAQCREGCKHIYYEPVPLPDELPENQKFTTIEDYFDAYQTIFVRNFQSVFISSSGASNIEWSKYGINTLGQKLIFANKKLEEFLARYYAPINKTAQSSVGPDGTLPNTYRYSPLQTGFYLDFSTCDGYVGEYWNGQSNPFGLSPPNLPRTIYFRNGTTVEIEGAVSLFNPTVRRAFWKEHDARNHGVFPLNVNEVAFSYVFKRKFKYKIKIPVQEMGDGYKFELKPRLANFWTDPQGNIFEVQVFPDATEVLSMVVDPNPLNRDDRAGQMPGPPYLQSNFTFPACYQIHQTPVTLPSPVNNGIRVLDYPNDKSKTTNLIDTIVQSSLLPGPPGYTLIDINLNDNLATYQKTTTVPTDQEVQTVKFPLSFTGTGLGGFPDA